MVFAKVHSNTEEVRKELLRDTWCRDPAEYPPLVLAKSLSANRQWYLFDRIREFCHREDRDITCSEPSVPKPKKRAAERE